MKQKPRFLNSRLVFWLLAASVASVASIRFIDRPVAELCRSLPPALPEVARYVSFAAGIPVATVLVLALIVAVYVNPRFRKRTQQSQQSKLFIVGTIILSWGVTHALKALFGRCRPELLFEHSSYGFRFFSTEYTYSSFPSGHTSFAFGLALALSFIRPRLRIPLLAVATLVALSRVVGGAHFVSDVIAGAAVGIFACLAALGFFRKQGHTIVPEETR